MSDLSKHKSTARRAARDMRSRVVDPHASQKLIGLFPHDLAHSVIAGFSPIGDEIDVWPLLRHLYDARRTIALPVVNSPASPLNFRKWTPQCDMATDQYGVSFPTAGVAITPTFILVPLLAFTASGERLGYGGGYYDRTLAQLRSQGDVFACGVGYAGQEVADLPTDEHDQPLDGMLTEKEFRTFR